MNFPRLKFPVIVTLLSVIFLVISCSKNKRQAEFVLTQYEYGAGDALQYENLTAKYDSCYWEIFGVDGQLEKTIGGNHPNLVTGIMFPNGLYTLRLTTLNRKDEVRSTVDKEFLIKSDRIPLKVNAYSNSTGVQDDYDVYVDGQFVGSSTTYGTFSKGIPVGWRFVQLIAPDETLEDMYYFDSDDFNVVINF